jgi:hypothetical protein
MFHPASVLEIGASFPSQTLRSLEKDHAPTARCQLAGNDHSRKPSTNDDCRRFIHDSEQSNIIISIWNYRILLVQSHKA